MKEYLRNFSFQMLVCVGLCSLVGLLSDVWWFFDLFNHFRPHAFIGSTLLFCLALILKDRRCVFLSLAIIILNATLIIERLNQFPSIKPFTANLDLERDTQTISVLFSNVLASNPRHDAFIDLALKNNPNIVAAAEVNESWNSSLASLQSKYPYSISIPRQDNFGMVIYSKAPFKSGHADISEQQIPLIVADFQEFTLIVVHPTPPVTGQYSDDIRIYMKRLADILHNTKQPVVIAGDFNATLWSKTFHDLQGLGLKRTSQTGFFWSWPSSFFPFAMQIDHIFVRNAEMADFKILSNIGSDHFPIQSTIVIARNQATLTK